MLNEIMILDNQSSVEQSKLGDKMVCQIPEQHPTLQSLPQ